MPINNCLICIVEEFNHIEQASKMVDLKSDWDRWSKAFAGSISDIATCNYY